MTRNEIAQIIFVEAMKQKVCCYGAFSDEDYKGVGLDGTFDLLAIADKILSVLEVPQCHSTSLLKQE